jgi:hypothetical protein
LSEDDKGNYSRDRIGVSEDEGEDRMEEEERSKRAME